MKHDAHVQAYFEALERAYGTNVWDDEIEPQYEGYTIDGDC